MLSLAESYTNHFTRIPGWKISVHLNKCVALNKVFILEAAVHIKISKSIGYEVIMKCKQNKRSTDINYFQYIFAFKTTCTYLLRYIHA